jgi:hypothetical protein
MVVLMENAERRLNEQPGITVKAVRRIHYAHHSPVYQWIGDFPKNNIDTAAN